MKQLINSNVLKIIAAITMLIDHVGAIFFPEIIILRIIGRISFPIFAFCIAEGYAKTHNKLKYFIRMCIFAAISYFPFVLALNNGFILNIMFTFAFSIIVLYLYDTMQAAKVRLNNALPENRDALSGKYLLYSAIFYVVLCGIISFTVLVPTDYYFYGVLTVLIFHIFHGNFKNQAIYFTLLTALFCLLTKDVHQTFIFNISQVFSLLSLPIIFLYNGQRGKLNLKYFFYIFYPLHLLILFTIKILI